MDWDVRHWTLFVFLIAYIMLIMATSTPYNIKGDNVYFGSQGLWRVDPSLIDGGDSVYYTITAALLCVCLALLLVAFIAYILLLRISSTILQVIVIGLQWLAAIFAFAAIGVFSSNEATHETGFWLAATAAAILLFNGIVLIFMPIMEYVEPKRSSDEVRLKGTQHL